MRAEKAKNRRQRANLSTEDGAPNRSISRESRENEDTAEARPGSGRDGGVRSEESRKARADRLEQRKQQRLQQEAQQKRHLSGEDEPQEQPVENEPAEISLEELARQATIAYEARFNKNKNPTARVPTGASGSSPTGADGTAASSAGAPATNELRTDDLNDLLTPLDVEMPGDPTATAAEQAKYMIVYPDAPLTPAERGAAGELRNMEEEGLFVAKKPFVPQKIQNKVEQRLHKDGSGSSNAGATSGAGSSSASPATSVSLWFRREDGLLNHEPSPIKLYNERPDHWYDPEAPYLQTRFMSPTVVQQTSDIALEKQYQLNIFLDHMKLFDHPLFSKEDMLAAQLELLYEEYVERQQLNLTLFYTQKLEALKQHLKYIKENPHVPSTPATQHPPLSVASSATSPLQHRLHRRTGSTAVSSPLASAGSSSVDEVGERLMNENRVREHIRQTRLLRDSEESTDLMLVKKMLVIHKQLKDLQQTQQYPPTTHISLLMNKVPCDEQRDKEMLKQQLEEEIQELREQHQANFADQLNNYRKQLEAQLQQQSTNSTNNAEEGGSSAPAGNSKFPVNAEFDERAARQQILERFKTTKKKPGKPILIPKLFRVQKENNDSNSTTVDFTSLPSHEQFRRTEISKSLLFLKLFVNNRFVTKTKLKPIDPATWTVHFSETISLQLVKWPDAIKLLLCAPVCHACLPFTYVPHIAVALFTNGLCSSGCH